MMTQILPYIQIEQNAEIKAGEEFQVPDALAKWPASATNTTDAGHVEARSELFDVFGEEVFLDRYYYTGDKPGFDFIRYMFGPTEAYMTVVVDDVDGNAPVKHDPVAVDDHLVLNAPADGVSFAALVKNDIFTDVDVVTDGEIRPLSSGFQALAYGWGEDIIGSVTHGSGEGVFIGSAQFEYRVKDVFDDWSNWAKIDVDFLNGSASRDAVSGTENADIIDFSSSSIAVGVHALGGDDVVRGSQASDNLYGDAGSDRIGGRAGDDVIDGGDGNDLLFGEAGNDILRGGAGNDQALGGAGDDRIGGKTGDDWLHGNEGNDSIWGDEGVDVLYGGTGDDRLSGGADDDILFGGLGIDSLSGGSGSDTFVFIRGEAEGDTVIDFEGAGLDGGDLLEFRGYGAGATLLHVSDDLWHIEDAGVTETIRIAGVTDLGSSDYLFA
jgi:Ca2+-binding RTX toxin-like protein